jgi:hypothetical protein
MGSAKKDKGVKRDPLDPREDRAKSNRPANSRSREESMRESGQDDFQNPRSSGTTGLGSESGSNPAREPGGVEGVEGSE